VSSCLVAIPLGSSVLFTPSATIESIYYNADIIIEISYSALTLCSDRFNPCNPHLRLQDEIKSLSMCLIVIYI
jgi:hypothetical protein